ncbi:sterol 14alpha-demethylase [Skeletonema marinoi]|uniref:Sterol 14alpha-demethylase n=1 Tax=Skeletonema marinoi TaxID=267567 RepID=A0AAD8YP23_9STRA|nr:sterol 14alpha-demethylase [Skeletonema marinoi]|mmetsp:Transcript_3574/g.5483  ORF Transcript_3574/g.5483 Transcript_3574/m.5483 type:complete len:512 (+) Transcript_3574:69-1604(+)|eukprot:scaffold11309_cov126-Skeletonema_dohrnii-CCMP3373.AAC.1
MTLPTSGAAPISVGGLVGGSDSMLLGLTCLSVLSLLYAFFVLRPRTKGGSSAPPTVTNSPVSGLPVVGTIVEFGKSPVKMVQRCYEEYGPVFTVPFFHKRLTFLIGPEAQEPFFKAPDEVLSQDEVYGFMKPVFGPGVVYDASKKNRQVQFQSMAHGLRTSRLKGYTAKIERETRQYLETWGESGEIDLFHALSELTILTSSRCLHGDDVRENLFKEVSELYHDLDHGLTPLTVFFPNAPTAAHKKRNEARAKMVELFGKVIKNRRDNPDVKHSDGTDILSIFMDVKYKDGSPITDEQVTGLLIALLFAGQHTSCITSTWTSLFILNNPEIMKRIVSEQMDIFGSEPDAAVDYKKVNEDMPLLHNSMKEALRLCPPLILLIRYAVKELKVKAAGKNYTIPKGDMVLISPSVGMRIPEVFKDPDAFDPDRFGPGREEDKSSPYAYMGFGGGMHSCMGQNFAFVQVKTILSVLFREFEMEMIADKVPDIDYEAMVVGPKGDCRIRYKKRQSSN